MELVIADDIYFRPKRARIIATLIVLVVIFFGISSLTTGDFRSRTSIVVLCFAYSIGAYITLWQPVAIVTSDRVIIQNLFMRHIVPFDAIESIDTKYSLSLRLQNGRRITVWVAPSMGAFGVSKLERGDVRHHESSGGQVGATVGIGDTLRSPSGELAALIRGRISENRETSIGQGNGQGNGHDSASASHDPIVLVESSWNILNMLLLAGTVLSLGLLIVLP